ncbi:arrestin homolog isoform X2 [Bemisia tabaci]|uniref:arrestin homolog isoform X2 n=1 Tax=Bemisia tabaci TaxID=7038 RepID=UPI003B289D89
MRLTPHRPAHALVRNDLKSPIESADVSSQRVFKKSAPNNKITLYLGSRDLIISNKSIDKIQGVVYVDPEYLQDKKVFGQVTLTFRYGREDEEVMGLKFCNEAIMCLAQLYPIHEKAVVEPNTPLQDALIKRLGPNAHPFTMEVTHLAPPSVQLVPAKAYNGAPIGTSYDVRAYAAYRADEKLHRRSTVRMGIRVVQLAAAPPPPSSNVATPCSEGGGGGGEGGGGGGGVALSLSAAAGTGAAPPHACVEKPFLLSDGKVHLDAQLDKSIYNHGDSILVTVSIKNRSSKSVRGIKVFVVQFVDVCMFSNGKFKNVVATIDRREESPLGSGTEVTRTFRLNPAKGATKNWIALEDSYNKSAASLASTVVCNSPEERNVFAIYVSYYVKVKLLISAIGGAVSLKLPFTLMHSPFDLDMSLSTPMAQVYDPLPTNSAEGVKEVEDEDFTITTSPGP